MLCSNMLRRKWAAALVLGAVALVRPTSGQQVPSQQTPGQPPTDPPSNGSGNSGANSSTPGAGTGSNGTGSRGAGPANPSIPRGISGTQSGGLTAGAARGQSGAAEGTIFGRVVLNDGAKPEGIAVQRFCGLNVTGEGFTDSSGHFTIQRVSNSGFGGDGGASDSAQGNCELRASLAGYRSDTLPLSTRHSNESNDAGVIVLRRVSAAYGLTVSATMLLAPKEARKSYDKGLEAIRRDHPDDAQKDFGDAVQIYPRFAGAWFELGKVYEQRNHLAQARGAYNSAIAADAGYLYPYERLYRLDIRESKWKEAAETSGKVLRLDPYEFPEAFYFNAVSNFELQNLDAAERSAREAAKLEGEQAEPRSNYILGVILWRKGDLDAAVEKIRTFLSSPHEGPEWKSAQRMLTDIQRQIGQRRLRSDCSEECAASDED